MIHSLIKLYKKISKFIILHKYYYWIRCEIYLSKFVCVQAVVLMENLKFVLFSRKKMEGMKSLLQEVVKMLQLWKVVYKEELKIRIDGCISVFLESKTMES